jgi:hypothetical protein
MFDDNFIDFTNTRRGKPTRYHRRYIKSHNINYYRPTVKDFKAWIEKYPPKETIVKILILQEYIQEVLMGMFHVDFPVEKIPKIFYTNISYIAYRYNKVFDKIDITLKYNDVLNQLWDDQFAIKVGATNNFDRLSKQW